MAQKFNLVKWMDEQGQRRGEIHAARALAGVTFGMLCTMLTLDSREVTDGGRESLTYEPIFIFGTGAMATVTLNQLENDADGNKRWDAGISIAEPGRKLDYCLPASLPHTVGSIALCQEFTNVSRALITQVERESKG